MNVNMLQKIKIKNHLIKKTEYEKKNYNIFLISFYNFYFKFVGIKN